MAELLLGIFGGIFLTCFAFARQVYSNPDDFMKNCEKLVAKAKELREDSED